MYKTQTNVLIEAFDRMQQTPFDWDGSVNLHGPMVRKVFDIERERGMTRKQWDILLGDCFRVVCESHGLKPYRRSYFTAFKTYEASKSWDVDSARRVFGKCKKHLRRLRVGSEKNEN